MATLSGQTIANTFDSLLHVEDDTAGLVASSVDSRVIQDGVGAASALALATDSVRITSTNKLYFNDVGGEYISGNGSHLTLTSGGDIILAVGATGSVYPSGDGGSQNTYYGHDAGTALISGGNYNTLFGYGTGAAITEGDFNVAIGGYVTMDSLVDGARNIAIGAGAMTAADGSESDNMAIGTDAMGTLNDNSSTRNIAIGNYAADGMGTVGAHIDNLFIGHNTGGGTWENNVSSYNVGIGNYSLGAAMDAALYNTACGYNAGGNVTTGDTNTFIGANAGSNITTGEQNVAIGYGALDALADDINNIAIGTGAMGAADRGSHANADINQNVCIGTNAGFGGDFGSANVDWIDTIAIGNGALDGSGAYMSRYNIFLGTDAGGGTWGSTGNTNNIGIGHHAMDAAMDDSNSSIGIGTDALGALTGGDSNVAVGYHVADALLTGSDNVAIGQDALGASTDVDQCVAIGRGAMSQANAAGNGNCDLTVAVGYLALGALLGGGDTGKYNTAVGSYAADGLSTGEANTAIGYNALTAADGFEIHNTCIGYAAGYTIDDGDRNTCIGSIARTSAATSNDQIVIGFNFAGTADDAVHIGNATRHIRCDYGSDQTWDAGSDERIKTVTGDSPLGLDFINDFPIITYTWKSASEYPEEFKDYDAGKTEPSDTLQHHGVTAQSVKAALDNVDGVTDFSGWDEDPDGMQTIGESAFVWPLIKAVQELSAKVKALEDAQ